MYTNRMPAFLHPAGQASVGQNVMNAISSVASGMLPPGAAGVNSQGQFVDASGNVIKDASGNVMMSPSATPQVVVAKPDGATVGGMLLSVLITVAVVGGAAYAGSYLSTRRAERGRRSSRSSR